MSGSYNLPFTEKEKETFFAASEEERTRFLNWRRDTIQGIINKNDLNASNKVLDGLINDYVALGGSANDFAFPGKKDEANSEGGEKDEANSGDGKKEEDYSEIIAAILKGMESASGYAKSQYENQLAAIEEQRKYSEELAKQAREEAIKKAYVNYDRSLSTYGQNAEKLAQMGLSNSGYSDYLNGVAYSSMVGGVQDAHKTENQAIQNAYYNASQQKAEAADTYYDRATAAQNAYQDRIVSLLGAIGSGEIDANTAITMAAAYGMDESVASVIGDVAKTNYENVVAEKTALLEALLAGEDDGYGGKTFATDEAIRAYANTLNITDESVIQGYIDTKNKNENEYKDKMIYDSALTQITADTTDADIDDLSFSDGSYKKRLKEKRNEAFVKKIIDSINAGTANGVGEFGDLTSVDALYDDGKGSLTLDQLQQCYFAYAIKWIDDGIEKYKDVEDGLKELDRLKFYKKISDADYDNLKAYMYNRIFTSVDNLEIESINKDKSGSGFDEIAFKIGNDQYVFPIDDVDSYSNRLLENYTGKGTVVKEGAYYFVRVGQAWKRILAPVGYLSDYKKLNKEFESSLYLTEIKAPIHSSN